MARTVGADGRHVSRSSDRAPDDPSADGDPGAEEVRRTVLRARGGGQPVPDEHAPLARADARCGLQWRAAAHGRPRPRAQPRAAVTGPSPLGTTSTSGEATTTLASPRGRRLLAHELTHVVQQGAAGTHASVPYGQVVQRELTDEARKVLQAAKATIGISRARDGLRRHRCPAEEQDIQRQAPRRDHEASSRRCACAGVPGSGLPGAVLRPTGAG